MAISHSATHGPLLLFVSFTILCLLSQYAISDSPQTNQCDDKCGKLQIPFPFFLNTSCRSISDAFRLSCQNSTELFLNIGPGSYRVLQFFPDGVLVNFPNTTSSSSCRPYNDLNAFGFEGNDYFGISADNVVALSDCEDSSLCQADCENRSALPDGCGSPGGFPACCYALSDGTSWRAGDGFSVFSQFGCRGFSCWVVVPWGNSTTGKGGVKLEWGVPRNSSEGKCAANAYTVNATSVSSGVRCQCHNGFVGDAFSLGVGCLKSCDKDGSEAYGQDSLVRGHDRRKVKILAGVLTSAFIIASLAAFLCRLKRILKSNSNGIDQGKVQVSNSFQKAYKRRLFIYHELEEATKGFDDAQKLADGTKGTLYAGVLGDGSHIVVHKVHCEIEGELNQVLSRVEVLSAVTHKNLARILGCCIDNGYTPLVVYESPANGTMEEHLRQSGGRQIGLDWYQRLKIASETAVALERLQNEISPPIFHHDLHSGCILLEEDFSVKIAGFGLLSANADSSNPLRSDVYSLGVILVEIIAGAKSMDLPTIALQKIRSGKLQEIVDPLLNYHEQSHFRREQIQTVADLATRCLLFGGDGGKLGMIDVARELVHVTKDSVDSGGGGSSRRPALEETFSNSSLLQMVSLSPDYVYEH